MPAKKEQPPFVSPCGKTRHRIQDAAECHARSETEIRRGIKRGELRALQMGRIWNIRCEDMERWIEETGYPNVAELERPSSLPRRP